MAGMNVDEQGVEMLRYVEETIIGQLGASDHIVPAGAKHKVAMITDCGAWARKRHTVQYCTCHE
jgi:hypothetical protein